MKKNIKKLIESNIVDWKTDIQNWKNISDNTAALMLEQSETLLKETVNTAESISLKAGKIISILVPAATALATYLFTIPQINLTVFLHLTAFLCLTVIIASLFFCYRNFEKYTISTPGELPRNIVKSIYIDNKYSEHEQYINLVLNTCENIQRRINVNEELNKLRTNNNTISLRILLFLILCPLLSYLLTLFFQYWYILNHFLFVALL